MAFICRFAPSPTGPLHIGGVRTALFNWLLAKKNKGKFYLRIEDTDKERSKEEFKKQIIDSLSWIGIQHDDKEYIQSKNINKHKEIAEELLKKGFAYKCYTLFFAFFFLLLNFFFRAIAFISKTFF